MPPEEGFHMGGAIYSGSLIKAIDACTFEDNEGWHGDDIYSDGMATTVIQRIPTLTRKKQITKLVSSGQFLPATLPSRLAYAPKR